MSGQPAARIADQTAHGGVITVGCPTVMIGNMPAARLGDMHACPMVTGMVPHVGGPLVLGSFTVLVGGMPQSRVSDMLVCVGPPDSVAAGCPTVMVGMAGSIGVMGLFRGLAMAGISLVEKLFGGGFPHCQLQTDGSYITLYSKAIKIEGTPEFQAAVIERLSLIVNTHSGRETVDSIDGSGKSMKIIEYQGDNSFAGPASFQDATPAGRPVYYGNGDPVYSDSGVQETGTGNGTDTTVEFNPTLTLPNPNDGEKPVPNDAILFHEMTHGSHMMKGSYDGTPMGGYDTVEEQTTISTGTPSEASYLNDRNYPWQRTSHGLDYAPNP